MTTKQVPVPPSARIRSIDGLRGLALLGILPMNILVFGLPLQSYTSPVGDGAVAGADLAAYVAGELLFEGAMRALFSMLFGAGIAMLATGERAKGAAIYYRRQFLLLCIGLVDVLALLWIGDILVPYALVGMILYPCRKWRPKALFVAAGLIFLSLALLHGSMFAVLTIVPERARAVEERIAAGEEVSAGERSLLDGWSEAEAALAPTGEVEPWEARRFRGSYVESFAANAGLFLELWPLVLFILWDSSACMLLGLALFKTGVLQGDRSSRFYTVLAVAGLATGLAVNGYEVAVKIGTGYSIQWTSGFVPTYDLGRVAWALGIAAVTVIAFRRGWLARLCDGLVAVGRMALTNYILQSALALAIFHDLGLGLWNDLARHELYLIVLAQWVVHFAFSSWWLRGFRFGPLEWLWRSLTYGRIEMPTRPGT